MATVSKELADTLAAQDGYYADDPRVLSIIEYDNNWGGKGYGLNYIDKGNRYTESEFVHNPRVYWQASDTE